MANININGPVVSALDDLRDIDLTTTAPTTNDVLKYDGAKFVPTAQDPGGVTSVNTLTGDVVLDKSHIGLTNVDDTSDVDKPISTATQTALDLKYNLTSGFPRSERFKSSFTITDGTRDFTLTKISDYYYQGNGTVHNVTTDKSLTFSDVEGMHFIYFNGETFAEAVNPTEATIESIIINYTFICAFYWDFDTKRSELVLDERHGLMDPEVHLRLHEGDGTIFLGGMELTIPNIDDASPSDLTALEFSLNEGHNKDEDIEHVIIQKLVTDNILEYAFEGVSGNLRRQSQNPYGMSVGVSSLINYNEFTGATWQITESPDNSFVWRHVYAAPMEDKTQTNYITFMGTGAYTSKADAEDSVLAEKNLIESKIPAPEYTHAYSLLYQTKTSYGNIYNTRLVTLSDGSNGFDFRLESSRKDSASTTVASSHIALSDKEVSNSHPASAVSYSNITSGIGSVDVQSAIDEIEARVDINDAKTGITAQQAADITANNAKVSADANATNQGNTFNGVDQLVQLDGTGKLPAIDGSQLTGLPSGTGTVDSVNSLTGIVVLDTDDISEGVTNKYYTEARVSANTDVVANTAKTGITAQQATDITTNNSKISYTDSAAVAANTAKVSYTDAAVDTRIGLAAIEDLANVILTTPADTEVLTYNGTNWVNSPGGSGGASVTISDTAPVSPTAGDMWWDSVNGILKVYYTDADSSQWVDASPIGSGGASSLDDLTDVDLTTTAPVTDDILVYDGTNFVPSAPSGGGGLEIVEFSLNAGDIYNDATDTWLDFEYASNSDQGVTWRNATAVILTRDGGGPLGVVESWTNGSKKYSGSQRFDFINTSQSRACRLTMQYYNTATSTVKCLLEKRDI